MSKNRFEAFSDGVFAFAATLLILGIAVPAGRTYADDADLRAALLHLWPNLVAYALSFLVMGVIWQNHHALYRAIAKLDRSTVMLNLLLLGIAAFVPFATSTLGTYWWTHSAEFLYGLTLTASSTVFNLMAYHLVRTGAFAAGVSQAAITKTIRTYRGAWLTYAAATLVALVLPVASFAIYVGMAVFHLLPRGVDSDGAI